MNNQSEDENANMCTYGQNSKQKPISQPVIAQPVVFSQPMAEPVVMSFPQAQQPMALGPNNTAIHLDTQVQVLKPAIVGHWSSGVFDCFNDGHTAIISALCGCYQFAKNLEDTKLGNFSQAIVMYLFLLLFPFLFMTTSFSSLVGLLSWMFMGCYTGAYRSKIRGKYEIPGEQFSDVAVHCLCACCALSQEARHIQNKI